MRKKPANEVLDYLKQNNFRFNPKWSKRNNLYETYGSKKGENLYIIRAWFCEDFWNLEFFKFEQVVKL